MPVTTRDYVAADGGFMAAAAKAGLSAGDVAPDFTLTSDAGEQVTLAVIADALRAGDPIRSPSR